MEKKKEDICVITADRAARCVRTPGDISIRLCLIKMFFFKGQQTFPGDFEATKAIYFSGEVGSPQVLFVPTEKGILNQTTMFSVPEPTRESYSCNTSS